jgi:hypothetical protein
MMPLAPVGVNSDHAVFAQFKECSNSRNPRKTNRVLQGRLSTTKGFFKNGTLVLLRVYKEQITVTHESEVYVQEPVGTRHDIFTVLALKIIDF